MNILHLTLFQIKISKKSIIGWCVSIFAFVFLYMILFSSMQEMAMMKFDAMPPEMMQFFGMEDLTTLANYTGYFGVIYNMILMAISIFLATFGAGLLAREETSKTIEFLYSQKTSRFEIYVSKILTGLVAALALIISATIPTVLCGYINGGETFVLLDILQIVKMTSITPIFFLFFGLFASAVTAKVSGATVGSFAVLTSYLLGFLGTLLNEDFKWLTYLSPFESVSPEKAVLFENETIIVIFAYFALCLMLFGIGGAVYKKRDFNI